MIPVTDCSNAMDSATLRKRTNGLQGVFEISYSDSGESIRVAGGL
jgi:hypothetical protein